ncbi:hypothetical protein BFW38_16965 [Terasakiispira papahanaumokuakeensis]|uniref:Uncharacterized protein n=1 Tax=Terasakiispira papahanaumokuakeensis TaxID=197479 RepID=A0A1E2VDE6_9GAMM|nr:hypothetical protein BFW38_16965 [Terasakiispira papahanaumokuakeensis]
MVEVVAAHEADGVLGGESANAGIIVAKAVVVKAGFAVVVLPLKSKGVLNVRFVALAVVGLGELAPGTVLAAP